MAKQEKEFVPQMAQCVKVKSFTMKDKNGNPESKEIYTFSLDGKEVEVFEGKYFKAVEGAYYYPRAFIYPKAYLDKRDGTPRVRMQVGVNWEAVRG